MLYIAFIFFIVTQVRLSFVQ